MPVRRRARQPRRLQRQDQPDMPEADLGDELLKAEPPVTGGARAAEVLVDHDDRPGRPAQLDGALAQRILARRRLHLRQRRLTHIHDRAPPAVRIADLAAVTHHARPPPVAPAVAPGAPSPRAGHPAAASPTPPPRPRAPRSPPAPTAPTRPPPRFAPEAPPRTGRDRTSSRRSANSRHAAGDPSTPNAAGATTRRRDQPHPRRQRINNMSSSTPTRPASARHIWPWRSGSAPAWPGNA